MPIYDGNGVALVAGTYRATGHKDTGRLPGHCRTCRSNLLGTKRKGELKIGSYNSYNSHNSYISYNSLKALNNTQIGCQTLLDIALDKKGKATAGDVGKDFYTFIKYATILGHIGYRNHALCARGNGAFG